MKPVIIIAIAFVLLIPLSIHAQESSDLVDYYKNLKIEGPTSELIVIDENQNILKIVGIEVKNFDYDVDLDKLYSINSRYNYDDREPSFAGIYITDSSLEKIEKFIPIGRTNVADLKINPVTKKAYVTLLNEEQIMVIDIKNNSILDIISFSEFNLEGEHDVLHNINPLNITIDELTNTIYFSYTFQIDNPVRSVGGIGIIDGNDDTIKGKIPLDISPWHLFVDEISKQMFVGALGNDGKTQLVIIDLKQNRVSNQLFFDSSILGGFVSYNNHLYFSQFDNADGPGMVYVLNKDTEKIIDSFETGVAPWSLDIDVQNKKLFVSTGYSTGIQIFDLESNILIDSLENTGIQDPIIFDESTNTIFLGMSNGIKKIEYQSQNTEPLETLDYRQTLVPDFPSYSKSPDEYIQRFQTDSGYKKWFDDTFPNNTIEEIVKYKTTQIENFPDNSKSPEYYVQRYFDESEYKEWFDVQFPNETLQNILGLSNEDMSTLLINIGIDNGKNGDDKRWLELVIMAVNYFPENPSAHTSKGYAEINLIEDKKAIFSFNQALKIDPNYVNATFGLGDANYNLGNIQVANQFYKSGLEQQPDDIWGLTGYGITLIELGDETGLEYIDKALEIDAHSDVAISDKLWALGVLEKYEQLMSFYNSLDEKYDDDPIILNAVGYALQNLERFDEAKLFYENALEIDPSFEYPKGNLRDLDKLVYQKNASSLQDNIKKMVELLEQAVENDENGNRGEAKKNFEEALELLETEIAPLAPDAKAQEEIDEKINEIKAQLYEYEKDSIKIPTSSKGGGCLIATATYGSELAPQVQHLRELRDISLLQTESGTNFMNLFNDVYYSFSPHIADYERENPLFKEMVKVAITPMITSLSILNYVDMDSEESVLGYGISLIILNAVMYVGFPVLAMVGLKKNRF
jgi:tetratricopeptide (TPR) repeat protein/DNA-binding beta-propeller fold protein YncE